ncbi:APC family permease [Streptomyces sp. 900116325]
MDQSSAGPSSKSRLRRDVGLIGLTFISLGSIVGSGWLLGALTAARTAGPAAIVSWVLAAVLIAVLALIHTELGAAYPVSGGTARFPHFAFGTLSGFTSGWMAWIGTVAAAPIEVEASLQYLGNKIPGLMHVSDGTPVLTSKGIAAAAVLMLFFAIVNFLGVRWLARVNNVLVWVKIAVPLLTIGVLVAVSFHPSNFHAGGGFAPHGFSGVLKALPAGVVYALLGFEYAIQMGGEARNPRRDIPRAVIGAMLIGTALYLLLQIVFIGALNPASLVHGWSDPIAKGALGPYAGLATSLGLGWLAFVLYVDAFISPSGSALINVGASSRLSFGLSRNGYLPSAFGRVSGRGVPAFSIVFSFVVGMIVLLPFPSWQQLVGFITSAFVLMYAFAPVTLAALRRSDPDRVRPYRLAGSRILAPFGFIGANLVIYWSGWHTVSRLLLAVLLGFALLAVSQATASRSRQRMDWRASSWIAPWLTGMAVISYLGQFDGSNVIPFWWDIVVVALFSLAVFYLACSVALPGERVAAYVRDDEVVADVPHTDGQRDAATV